MKFLYENVSVQITFWMGQFHVLLGSGASASPLPHHVTEFLAILLVLQPKADVLIGFLHSKFSARDRQYDENTQQGYPYAVLSAYLYRGKRYIHIVQRECAASKVVILSIDN